MSLKDDNEMVFFNVKMKGLYDAILFNLLGAHIEDFIVFGLDTVGLSFFLNWWCFIPTRCDRISCAFFKRLFFIEWCFCKRNWRLEFLLKLCNLSILIWDWFDRGYNKLLRHNTVGYHRLLILQNPHQIRNIKLFTNRLTGPKSSQKTLIL